MIHAENQVRNFYVFKKGYAPDYANFDSRPNGSAMTVLKDGKFYIKYKDHLTGKILTSDVVDVKQIKDLRLTVPYGWKGYSFTLAKDTNVVLNDGDVVQFDFHFSNVFGFSDREQYHRTYQVAYSSTGDTVLQKLNKALKASNDYNADAIFNSAFEVGDWSSDSFTILEADQEYNAIRGFYPHTVKCMISSKVIIKEGNTTSVATGKGGYLATNNASSTEVGWLANYAVDKNGIATNASTTGGHSKPNDYKIEDLQYAQSKVRADMYGYNGYPDINPTDLPEVNSWDADNNLYAGYIECDIKYAKKLAGINVQESDKELSFAIVAGRLGDILDMVDGVLGTFVDADVAALVSSNAGVEGKTAVMTLYK